MPRVVRQDALEFATRLCKIADNHPIAFKGGRGRYKWFVEELDRNWPEAKIKSGRATAHVASMASVSKWFNGQAIPDRDNIERIARLLDADVDWLATGSLGHSFRPVRVSLEKRDKAAIVIFGEFARLAGGDYGFPRENDPRVQYVDLDIMLEGQSIGARVMTPDPAGPGVYELPVPKNVGKSEIVVAMQTSAFTFDFVHIPAEVFEVGPKRRPLTVLPLVKKGDNYEVAGSKLLPVMENFDSLV